MYVLSSNNLETLPFTTARQYSLSFVQIICLIRQIYLSTEKEYVMAEFRAESYHGKGEDRQAEGPKLGQMRRR